MIVDKLDLEPLGQYLEIKAFEAGAVLPEPVEMAWESIA